MTIEVEIHYRMDDTTKVNTFTAGSARTTMHPSGRTVVDLQGGRDDQGPVIGASYQYAYRVLRRPVVEEEK